jgi:hypothetical protein
MAGARRVSAGKREALQIGDWRGDGAPRLQHYALAWVWTTSHYWAALSKNRRLDRVSPYRMTRYAYSIPAHAQIGREPRQAFGG